MSRFNRRKIGVAVSTRSGAVLGWDAFAFEANRQAEIEFWFKGRTPMPMYTPDTRAAARSQNWHNTNGQMMRGRA